MNLFARILSHGFALVVVALLAVGLIYRGELFPELNLPDYLAHGKKPGTATVIRDEAAVQAPDTATSQSTDAGITADVSAVPEPELVPSASIDRSMSEPVAGGITDDRQPEAPASDEPAVTGTAEAVQEVQPPLASPAQPPAYPLTGEADKIARQPDAGADASSDTAPSEMPATEAISLPADAGESTISSDTQAVTSHAPAAVTPYRILAAAREAYWLRDYASAEQKYKELIALDPENPDGYGELGNMYFSQGDWDKASASYYDAGTRLAAQGMFTRARQMVEVIRGLNGGQAGDLEQHINAAESAAP
jgi:tetratricopeptide (TPR) repeat protein